MAVNWHVIEDTCAAASRPVALEYQIPPVIEYSGNFWFAGMRTIAPTTNNIGTYKSTDGRLTWASQNQASSPLEIEATAFRPSVGSLIHYAYYVSGTFEIRLIRLDMATGLYGAPIAGGPTFAGSNVAAPNMWNAVLSNGDEWVFYSVNTGGGDHNSIYGVKYDGAWGAPVLVADGAAGTINNTLRGVTVDASDRIYLFIQRNLTSGGFARTRIILNTMAGGGLSGEQQIADAIGTRSTFSSTPKYDAVAGKVRWVWHKAFGGPPFHTEVALVSVDTSALTYVVDDVADPTVVNDIWYHTAVAIRANGEIWVLVYNENSGGITQILYFVNSGSGFGPQQVYWDDTVDPIPAPYAPEVNSITATWISDGSLVVTVGGLGCTPVCAIQYVSSRFGPAPSGKKFLPQYIKRPNNANA